LDESNNNSGSDRKDGSSPMKADGGISKGKAINDNHVTVPIASSSDDSEFGVRGDDKNSQSPNSSNDFPFTSNGSEKFKKTLRLTSEQIVSEKNPLLRMHCA